MDNLKAQGIRSFIWDFAGKLATQGMGFVVSIFLARLLEPAEFGLIAMVMVIIGIAAIFTDIGLSGALVQKRRLLAIHYSSVFYFNLLVGTLLTLLVFFSASAIADFYNNERLILLTQVISISFVIGAFSSVQSTKLRRELNYALLTKIQFISSLIGGVIGVSLAFLGAGVWSLVAMTLFGGIMYNILIWSAAKWTPSLHFSVKALKSLWAFGFRMFLARLLDTIFIRLDFMIIGKLFNAATLGFFQRARSLDEMVAQYSSGSLMNVLFPVLSKVQNDLPRFQNIIIKSLGFICFVVFLLTGGLYLVSEELIVLLFGEKWLPSVDYFKIMLLSGFAYPVSALLVNVLSSRGNSKAFLRLEIYKKILLSITLYFGFMFGIEGYLYALILESILSVSLNIHYASREITIPFFTFAKPMIVQAGVTILAVLITFLLIQDIQAGNFASLMIKGSLFVLLYLSINWILKTSSYVFFSEQVSPLLRKIFK